MAKWVFEPGHTAAEFRARHMMVSWVRGHFKDVHGSVEFDPDNPLQLAIETTLQAHLLWTGEAQRDNHLRSADFLDVAQHRTITFRSTASKCVGPTDYEVTGDLSIRGVSRWMWRRCSSQKGRRRFKNEAQLRDTRPRKKLACL